MFPKSTQLYLTSEGIAMYECLTPARGSLHYEICSKESC